MANASIMLVVTTHVTINTILSNTLLNRFKLYKIKNKNNWEKISASDPSKDFLLHPFYIIILLYKALNL